MNADLSTHFLKPKRLHFGDKVAVVSLSSGVLGEPFAKHELLLGEQRLKEVFGLEVVYGEYALAGQDFIKKHPESRADDLKTAFADPSVKAVICAIGGDDTYRTAPFLLNDEKFLRDVRCHPKIFIGFSDTTVNHFMFFKLGLQTYYGASFLTDFAELSEKMLPYTKEWIGELFSPHEKKKVLPSPIWYEERKSYALSEVGKNRKQYREKHGYEVLHGSGVVSGRLLGGCIESMCDLLSGERHAEEKLVNEKYGILPKLEDWKDKVFFFETSEEKPSPDRLTIMLKALEKYGIFDLVNALVIGKPQDEVYYDEYKNIYTELAVRHNVPTIYNLNFGHSCPRLVLPYGAEVAVDFDTGAVLLVDEMVG
jgi:muramoyltetrapeptide carboxypeptidase LdcA involved in peptidoglycan recycling